MPHIRRHPRYSLAMPKQPKIATVGVRVDAEDRKIIDALKKRLGVSTDSQIFRMGLRALAREQKGNS